MRAWVQIVAAAVAVLFAASLVPSGLMTIASLAFLWSTAGLLAPRLVRLGTRPRAALLSIGSLILIGVAAGSAVDQQGPRLTADGLRATPTADRPALESAAVHAPHGDDEALETPPAARPPVRPATRLTEQADPRIHADSSFKREVGRMLRDTSLGGVATSARAFHNDVEFTVNRDATALLSATSCDQQRDFAASLWIEWNEMGVGAGAGVTIKSYTGRVLASIEEGFTGARFHCE